MPPSQLMALARSAARAAIRRIPYRHCILLEDLEQEAVSFLLQSDTSLPESYLFNRARDRCRQILNRELQGRERYEPMPHDLPGPDIPPIEASEDMRNLVWSKLPVPIATAIDLHYWQGLSILDVSIDMKLSINAVEYLLARGRQIIQRILCENSR